MKLFRRHDDDVPTRPGKYGAPSCIAPLHVVPLRFRGDDYHPCIGLATRRELDYWSDLLGVSESALKASIAEVGPRVADVLVNLGK